MVNHKAWFDYANIYDMAVDRFDRGVFVELGSFCGNSSKYLAHKIKESGKPIKLICVDLWPAPHELGELQPLGAGQNAEEVVIRGQNESLMQTFIDDIRPYRDIVVPIRTTTSLAAQIFAQQTFSFIFVDAGHTYAQVLNDLQDWYPKLTNTGIIAGHDYNAIGVKQAVDDFFGIGSVQPNNNSWIYQK